MTSRGPSEFTARKKKQARFRAVQNVDVLCGLGEGLRESVAVLHKILKDLQKKSIFVHSKYKSLIGHQFYSH